MKAKHLAERVGGIFAHLAKWLICVFVAIYVLSYMFDARVRYMRSPGCRWNQIPKTVDEPYLAQFCYLTKDTVLLRLYDITNRHLLAERMFFNMDLPNFYWDSDALGYETTPDGGVISLPPTLLDRVRAKLP